MQPPARHTNDNLRPLKSGSTCLYVPVCVHDAVSSKPASVGRDAADLHVYVITPFGVIYPPATRGRVRPSG